MLLYQGVTKKLWWCYGGAWTILLAGFAYSSIFCHLIWFDSLLVRPMCAINIDVSSSIWMCIAYLHPFLEATGVPVRAKNVPLQYGMLKQRRQPLKDIRPASFFSFWSWDTDKWLLRALYTCHILPSFLFSRSSILFLIIELLMPKVCWSNPHSCSFCLWLHHCSVGILNMARPTPRSLSLRRYQKQNNHLDPFRSLRVSRIFRETHAHYSLVQSPQSPCFTENHHPIQRPKFKDISIIPICFLVKTKSRTIYSFIHCSSPNSFDLFCCFVTRLYHLFSIARENHNC